MNKHVYRILQFITCTFPFYYSHLFCSPFLLTQRKPLGRKWWSESHRQDGPHCPCCV